MTEDRTTHEVRVCAISCCWGRSPNMRHNSAFIAALVVLLVGPIHAFVPVRSIFTRSIASATQNLPRETCLNVATEVEPETFSFESNVSRVMDIIIHSLYSNKDVFLRELVSYSSSLLSLYFLYTRQVIMTIVCYVLILLLFADLECC